MSKMVENSEDSKFSAREQRDVVAYIYATSSFGLKVKIVGVENGTEKGLLSVATDTCVSVRKRR